MTAYVGSSNLSATALGPGIEWNFRVRSCDDPLGVREIQAAFETLFIHPQTQKLTPAWIESYRARRVDTYWPKAAEVEQEFVAQLPAQPHSIQIEALAALEATRSEGNTAGLVVLATGLGKTWLSAFDSCRADYQRILFVAHRDEILTQAMSTFRRIRPHAVMGKYTGTERLDGADILFASIQTLGRAHHLRLFSPDAFDYIVVDEFHHAAAKTYRTLLDHFTPKFMLGLTATPERTDGGDLLALCQENLVYRCDLAEGITQSLLSPFAYFGVPDEVDYGNIPWRSSRFDEEALTEALATTKRAENILAQYKLHAGTRTLAFCSSQRHADFMAAFFREKGLKAVAVHSGPTSARRAAALDQLSSGELHIVCSVDMFNEGVDVPTVDTVMMLRPTESRILFLQQLGRGLRLAPEKLKLTVIDYIGNHRAFLLKPRALLGLTDSEIDLVAALEKIRNGSFPLPPGCSVTYDLVALDMLSALIRTRSGDDLFKSYYVDFRARYGARPSASEAYHDGYAPRALRPSYGSWLRFVQNMDDLDQAETAAFAQTQSFLDALESTPMTKGFKMLVLLAMLNENAFPGQIHITDLTKSVVRLASRSAIWKKDFDCSLEDETAVKDVLERNPIAAWVGGRGTRDRSYFKYEESLFSSLIVVDSGYREAFQGLVREIVDWRIAEYLRRSDSELVSEGFVAKVSHSSGRPILFLPDRKQRRDIPSGETAVIVDGEEMIATFVKIALNVVRRPESTENQLPTILQGWFGPDAGLPGTSHEVHFSLNEDTQVWTMEPSKRSQTNVAPQIWHQ